MQQQGDGGLAVILLGQVERGHVPVILDIELRLVLDQERDTGGVAKLGCTVERRRAVLQKSNKATGLFSLGYF